MKFLKRALVVLVILLLMIPAVAMFLPDHAHIQREVVIARTPAHVYAVIEDMRRFNAWSPWFDIDPATQYTYEGPRRGIGAKLAWSSQHPDVGVGSQIITVAEPGRALGTHLDFGEMGQADAKLTLEAVDGGTRVTWGFDSDLPLNLDGKFLFNVVGRFMGLSFDSMLGPYYERGLGKLKTVVEALPADDWTGLAIDAIDRPAAKAYVVSATSATDAAASETALTAAYAEIDTFLAANGLVDNGPPFAVITAHEDNTWSFDAGRPTQNASAAPVEPVRLIDMPAGPAVRALHVGGYDALGDTHRKLNAYLAAHAMKERDRRMEIYLDETADTPNEKLRTEIVQGIEADDTR